MEKYLTSLLEDIKNFTTKSIIVVLSIHFFVVANWLNREYFNRNTPIIIFKVEVQSEYISLILGIVYCIMFINVCLKVNQLKWLICEHEKKGKECNIYEIISYQIWTLSPFKKAKIGFAVFSSIIFLCCTNFLQITIGHLFFSENHCIKRLYFYIGVINAILFCLSIVALLFTFRNIFWIRNKMDESYT